MPKRYKTKSSLSHKKVKVVLDTENNADEELAYLEKIVLGTGTEIFEDYDSNHEDNDNTCISNIEKRQPAWIDESDILEEAEVVNGSNKDFNKNSDQKSREYKFHQVSKEPKWAKYNSVVTQVKSLNHCGNLIKKPKCLGKGILEFEKLKDLNCQLYNERAINVIKFHPTSTVAMVAGLSGIVSLFQVDGKENTKLQSIKFYRFPIDCASFLKNGDEFIIGSRQHKYFHNFNLITGKMYKVSNAKMDSIHNMKNFVVSPNGKFIAVCGKLGLIHILSALTKECIDNLQMNCNVNCLAFNNDGSMLYSHGDESEVYIWDMNSRQCIKKFIDDGCLSGTAIDISSNNQLLACGSSSGVVNIYETSNFTSNKIMPLKTFYNLVTSITNVSFNPTSEILSISSYHKDNAVKLINLSSMDVFSNFPPFQSTLHHINCVDFSPNSGYFAIGNSQKRAHLFRLKYFGNY